MARLPDRSPRKPGTPYAVTKVTAEWLTQEAQALGVQEKRWIVDL
jgi:GDP-D-mannose dehydratase